MNDTGVTRETETFFRRLTEPLTLGGQEVDPNWWLAFLIPVLVLGLAYVAFMYYRDSRTIAWPWAVLLAGMRVAVYLIIGYIFLLPAKQVWEKTEKHSRVAVVLDVSPSMLDVSDDRPEDVGSSARRRTRFEEVVALLTDEKVALLKGLMGKNPVAVYRAGGRADDEPTVLTSADAVPPEPQWRRWARYDFKQWLLDGVSEPGRQALESFGPFQQEDAGSSDWAIGWLQLLRQKPDDALPPALPPEDRQRVLARAAKLSDRIEVARQIASGTDVAGSALSVLEREANNLLQAVVVISDGRSNKGSDTSLAELRSRAKKENVPVFTIAVGEDRPKVEIRITDVQAPTLTPPDEKFKIYVEVDGEGLPGQEVPVALDLIPPGAEEAAHSLSGTLRFAPGEPPHVQAEFLLDPLDMTLPEALTAESEKKKDARDFVQGEWKVVARVPKDRRELFAGPEHVSEPTKVQVLESPLRVLVVASGPVRDFQFVRTMLVREGERAELSVLLQNEGGRAGEIVADVDPKRLLTKFPDHLDVEAFKTETPEEKPYNLAAYDVILAFDPDWSRVSDGQLQMIERWVDKGGGMIYVAGPIHTAQLARLEDQRVRPLLNVLPVIPGDNVLATIRRSTDKPWRLSFPGVSPDTDFLKLDDAKEGPLAGWEPFFTGRETEREGANALVRRGFYNFYPVKEVKPGAEVVARFGDPDARGQDGKDAPFLVTLQSREGRTVFLGSEEMWRLRGYDRAYYERFWLKLLRYAGAGSRKKQDRRGRLLVSKEFAERGYIRVQAQLLDARLDPLPENAAPKMTIQRLGVEGEAARVKPFQMTAKKSAGQWDGMFQRQVLADPREFPPGEYRLEIEVPDSTEVLSSTFRVRPSDPEMDNTRPDYALLTEMASDVDEVAARFDDKAAAERLRASLSPGSRRLAFRLDDRGAIAQIPALVATDVKVSRNRGPIEDQWDKGPTLPAWSTGWFTDRPVQVSTLLLVVVGLLSAEWLTRKLLRLA